MGAEGENGDSESWLSGNWEEANDRLGGELRGKKQVWAENTSIPLPSTSWEAMGMKGLKESSIIELLLKSLQGLSTIWDARIEQHLGN